jgi:hypothetical protein
MKTYTEAQIRAAAMNEWVCGSYADELMARLRNPKPAYRDDLPVLYYSDWREKEGVCRVRDMPVTETNINVRPLIETERVGKMLHQTLLDCAGLSVEHHAQMLDGMNAKFATYCQESPDD